MAQPTISNTYVGDGSTILYSFTFPYIEVPDVKVTLDGVATTEYIFANATTIQFNVAPTTGAAISIFRDTDFVDLKSVFFPGSAVRARDLNDNFTQSLYAVQESRAVAEASNTKAAAAEASAATASNDATAAASSAAAASAQATASAASSASALAASQQASTDATAAQASSTAAAASSASAASDAAQAATDSATAITTANNASSTATDALNNSRQSNGQGGFTSAISIANAATTEAAQAITDSASAVTTANTADANSTIALTNSRQSDGSGGFDSAISIANTASTTANSALSNSRQSDGQGGFDSAITIANTALTNSRQSDGSGGFDSAISIANSAASTANAASNAVSTAAFYTPIAALANLPGSPSNEDRVEVVNSTGVESNSSVSGVPSGFVGSTDLTVRLQYNSSTSKWAWQQYFAADPENRYLTESLPVVKGDSTNGSGQITLNCENNSHGIKIKGPPHSAGANYTLTLPNNTGTTGQALTTNGSGVLSFSTVDSAFIETPQSITTNKVIAANINAGMMGPTVAINSGISITVGANSQLTVLN
jgi:hypothetical protein